MLKISGLILVAAFSTGFAVDVEEVSAESVATESTSESPVDLAPQDDAVPASVSIEQQECLAQCALENWICIMDCDTPFCHMQCDTITQLCQHHCYVLDDDET